MLKLFRSPACLTLILTTVFSNFLVALAQDEPPRPPPPPMPPGYSRDNADDDKGSIVRGRAFYQDTATPVRRGWIGLIKIRELVEKPDADETNGIATRIGSYGANNYVLTNDEGEFVFKVVKAGIYQPTFKVQGIINPDAADRETLLYPEIIVDGISEVAIQIPARRGGAVSGRILYSDGESVIGARVQVTKKTESERIVRYSYGSSDDNTTGITDDRGAYRFAGLPAGEYVVRVIEPSVHNESNNSVSEYNTRAYTSSSLLTTFYPGASQLDEAQSIAVAAGQEQGDINITIPNRRLFKISGAVVAKNIKTSLKNLKITFQKGDDELMVQYNYDESKQTKTDEQGKWSFVDLPKGKYLVKVESANSYGAMTTAATSDNQPKFAPASKEIEIDNENLQDVILELFAESAISGTITVEGDNEFPKFISLTAFDEQNKVSSGAYLGANRDGNKPQPKKTQETFRIGELSAGKYYLNAAAGENFYVKSMRAGGTTDLLNSPIEIGDGKEITDVQIVLGTDLGTLTGKITNFTRSEATFVVLLPVGKSGVNRLINSRQTFPGKTGDFSVPAPPGEYYVLIGTRSNQPKEGKFDEWIAELTANAPKVTIKAKETATITLSQPAK